LIYLFTGRTSVFETMVVAAAYLNEGKSTEGISYFMDINTELQGIPVYVGADPQGNQIYTLGTNNYQIVPEIVRELERVTCKENQVLLAIPVTIAGENITLLMARGTRVPFIGKWLRRIVLRRLQRRKNYLLEYGMEIKQKLNPVDVNRLAAKPLQ